MALVITFEAIGLKMLSFEFDVYTGIDPEVAILNIMRRHSSFMKSLAFPMIKIICICKLIDDPVKMANEIITDENTVKQAKKKAEESGYAYKLEENGLTAIESFKIEQMDNIIHKKKKSSEAVGLLAFVTAASNSLLSTAAGGAFAGLAPVLGPLVAAILVFSVIIILLLVAIPIARLIIYWVNVKKVDFQKELEIQAELLNNNIVLLQEKLVKTNNAEERAKLQNIISKQIELLAKLQNNINKYLDEEYEAAVDAQKEAENDENSQDASIDGNEAGNDDFEVSI
jgi:hypothetical protein